MSKHNIGFALFLFCLFIAPDLPTSILGLSSSDEVGIPMGFAGLAVWFLLSSPSLGIKNIYRINHIFLLALFGCYIVIVSMYSLRLLSALYAMHYFYYILLCGALIPSYLKYKINQGRLSEVFNIFALISAVYIFGLIISFWTGPIYPDKVMASTRYYEGIAVQRAAGFSASVNGAGLMAAIMAAFFLFIYSRQTKLGYLLAVLSLLGMVLTLSRSAVLSFIVAAIALGLLCIVRILAARFRRPSVPRFTPLLAVALVAVAAVAAGALSLSPQGRQLVVQTTYYGLGLDRAVAAKDTDLRIEIWQQGLRSWAERPALQKMFGAGFFNSSRTSRSGAYITSHNVYIQMLNDFGIVGVLFFVSLLATLIWRAMFNIVKYGYNNIDAFCFMGLTVTAVHNMSEVFLYHVSAVTLLILLISLTHLKDRERQSFRFEQRLEASRRWAGQIS